MKVLTIGNSFSQDAARYLHKMAAENSQNLKVVNLFIPACSLKTHYYNILDNNRAYRFEFNGEGTGIFVSVKDALISDEWDFVTVQQVSSLSAKPESYQPYLKELTAYIHKYCPHTKILVHQTWAYEDNSAKLSAQGFQTGAEMFQKVEKCYQTAAKEISAAGIIPAGKVFQKCLEGGLEKIHRDTYHASLGAGRYALALTWLCYLTELNPEDVVFTQFDAETTPEEIRIVKNAVRQCLQEKVL